MGQTKEEKSNANNQAWTIKGIELETRLAVQKAAKKEGMTLGKYCNTKLREAAINTLKIGNSVSLQPEDIRDEVKIQINALKEELLETVKTAIKQVRPEPKSLMKKIFG